MVSLFMIQIAFILLVGSDGHPHSSVIRREKPSPEPPQIERASINGHGQIVAADLAEDLAEPSEDTGEMEALLQAKDLGVRAKDMVEDDRRRPSRNRRRPSPAPPPPPPPPPAPVPTPSSSRRSSRSRRTGSRKNTIAPVSVPAAAPPAVSTPAAVSANPSPARSSPSPSSSARCTNGRNSCQTCKRGGSSCETCKDSKYLDPDGSCVSTCPNEYFGRGTGTTRRTCERCSSSCKKCTSVTTCTECLDANILEGGVCVAPCGDGFYRTSGKICAQCDSSCSKCEFTATHCTYCDNKKFNVDGLCLDTCPEGTYMDWANKDKMLSHRDNDAGRFCSNCPAHCNKCAAAGYCTECANQKYLQKKTEHYQLGADHLVCQSSCDTGYVMQGTGDIGRTCVAEASTTSPPDCPTGEYTECNGVNACSPCKVCSGKVTRNKPPPYQPLSAGVSPSDCSPCESGKEHWDGQDECHEPCESGSMYTSTKCLAGVRADYCMWLDGTGGRITQRCQRKWTTGGLHKGCLNKHLSYTDSSVHNGVTTQHYNAFLQAVAACLINDQCSGVYDQGCDGGTLQQCVWGDNWGYHGPHWVRNDEGSCIYRKPKGLPGAFPSDVEGEW